MKPRLFVASSVEGLGIAYAIQVNLEYDFEVTVWPQGVFEPTKFALESLLKSLDMFDAAVFVFTADDELISRKQTISKVRDNVIFELGLFLGKLGRDRCFIVMPREKDPPALPTDLIGVTTLTYDPNRQDSNLEASLGPAANRIRKALLPSGTGGSPKIPSKKTTIKDRALLGAYRFVYAPKMNQSKRLVFGADGFIVEGNNKNEHKWSEVNDHLEIINLEGKVFSRFKYDEKAHRFISTNDSALPGFPDQYMFLET